MNYIKSEIRAGAYFDSVVLMQLQKSLAALPDVIDAGVVMGTPANKEVLEASGLVSAETHSANPDDLIIVINAHNQAAAVAALAQVDELVKRRRSGGTVAGFSPKSMANAAKMLPDADWVLISVAGRYAAAVADQALDLGKHVFLYSDNVSVADEIRLKKKAAARDLLIMGPDCGTAIVNGIGLGFANRVRRGAIGVVGASGTGIQAITAAIHQLGGGISQAIGTGGRDLKDAVGGLTMAQGLALLQADPDTKSIVIVSKPPSAEVAAKILSAARNTGMPVIIAFQGYPAPAPQLGNLTFAQSLGHAAKLAVAAENDGENGAVPVRQLPKTGGYLRGLFSGGTLAYEALLALRPVLSNLHANLNVPGVAALSDPLQSVAHTLIDLGEDVFTQGRLHPMMDNDLRIRRLHEEAADPEVGLIMLDVVLGEGAHADPASELAPVIAEIKAARAIEVYAIIVGTDDDPQDRQSQIAQLEAVGAHIFTDVIDAADAALSALTPSHDSKPLPQPLPTHFAAINIGLESFAESIISQGAEAVHVDWRPPAGGNAKMMALLARMKKKS